MDVPELDGDGVDAADDLGVAVHAVVDLHRRHRRHQGQEAEGKEGGHGRELEGRWEEQEVSDGKAGRGALYGRGWQLKGLPGGKRSSLSHFHLHRPILTAAPPVLRMQWMHWVHCQGAVPLIGEHRPPSDLKGPLRGQMLRDTENQAPPLSPFPSSPLCAGERTQPE